MSKRKALHPNSDFADGFSCDVHRGRCLRWLSFFGPADLLAIFHLEFALLCSCLDGYRSSNYRGGQSGSEGSGDPCRSSRRHSRGFCCIASAPDRMGEISHIAGSRNQPLHQLAVVLLDGMAGFLCGAGSRRNGPLPLAAFPDHESSTLTEK